MNGPKDRRPLPPRTIPFEEDFPRAVPRAREGLDYERLARLMSEIAGQSFPRTLSFFQVDSLTQFAIRTQAAELEGEDVATVDPATEQGMGIIDKFLESPQGLLWGQAFGVRSRQANELLALAQEKPVFSPQDAKDFTDQMVDSVLSDLPGLGVTLTANTRAAIEQLVNVSVPVALDRMKEFGQFTPIGAAEAEGIDGRILTALNNNLMVYERFPGTPLPTERMAATLQAMQTQGLISPEAYSRIDPTAGALTAIAQRQRETRALGRFEDDAFTQEAMGILQGVEQNWRRIETLSASSGEGSTYFSAVTSAISASPEVFPSTQKLDRARAQMVALATDIFKPDGTLRSSSEVLDRIIARVPGLAHLNPLSAPANSPQREAVNRARQLAIADLDVKLGDIATSDITETEKSIEAANLIVPYLMPGGDFDQTIADVMGEDEAFRLSTSDGRLKEVDEALSSAGYTPADVLPEDREALAQVLREEGTAIGFDRFLEQQLPNLLDRKVEADRQEAQAPAVRASGEFLAKTPAEQATQIGQRAAGFMQPTAFGTRFRNIEQQAIDAEGRRLGRELQNEVATRLAQNPERGVDAVTDEVRSQFAPTAPGRFDFKAGPPPPSGGLVDFMGEARRNAPAHIERALAAQREQAGQFGEFPTFANRGQAPPVFGLGSMFRSESGQIAPWTGPQQPALPTSLELTEQISQLSRGDTGFFNFFSDLVPEFQKQFQTRQREALSDALAENRRRERGWSEPGFGPWRWDVEKQKMVRDKGPRKHHGFLTPSTPGAQRRFIERESNVGTFSEFLTQQEPEARRIFGMLPQTEAQRARRRFGISRFQRPV